MIDHDSRVYIWRKRDEEWRPDFVTLRGTRACFEVTILACITSHGVGTITTIKDNINAEKYQQIPNLRPVLVLYFPEGN